MKSNFVLLFVCVLLSTFSASAQTEKLTVPLSSPGKTYTLNVQLLNGSIHIGTHPGVELIIEAIPASTGDDEENNETVDGMKKISHKDGFEITADENNNVVNVHNKSFNNAVSLNIKVPQQAGKFKLNTVNEGDIVIENVSGEIEVNNINGAISAGNISGSVVATTIAGDIKVNFRTVNGNAAMAFSSLSGNVDITLPQDIKANLKLKSDMGDIYSDFDIIVDKSQSRISNTKESGMYKLAVDDWVYGKINGGGPELMFKNMTGDIFIRKLK